MFLVLLVWTLYVLPAALEVPLLLLVLSDPLHVMVGDVADDLRIGLNHNHHHQLSLNDSGKSSQERIFVNQFFAVERSLIRNHWNKNSSLKRKVNFCRVVIIMTAG